MSPARPRRLGLIIPWALFALLAIGWTGYWFALRARTIELVDDALAAERARGAVASYARVSASGYPLRLTLHYDKASYTAKGAGWEVSTPRVDLHVNPSQLDLVILEPHGPVTWRNKTVTRTLTARVSAVSVNFKKGALTEVRASAEDLQIVREGQPPQLVRTMIVGARPDPRNANDLQVSVDVSELALAAAPAGFEGLGEKIAQISARVVLEQSPARAGAARDRAPAWSGQGKAARYESLALLWGPAKLTGAGRIALDPARLPVGRLDLTLETAGPTPDMAPIMAGVFAAAAQINAATGNPAPIALRFETGVLKVGDLPVRPLDPVL